MNSLAEFLESDYLNLVNEVSQQLQRLESHMAHLEHQVEQLNDVVIDQGKLVDRLKKEVQRQSVLLKTLELDRIKANNPRPPHHEK